MLYFSSYIESKLLNLQNFYFLKYNHTISKLPSVDILTYEQIVHNKFHKNVLSLILK